MKKTIKSQIMALFNKGLTNTQIARQVGCTRATVLYHTNPDRPAKVKSAVKARREAAKSCTAS